MRVELHEQAIIDFEFWKKSGNKAIQKKIEQLIIVIQEILLWALVNQKN